MVAHFICLFLWTQYRRDTYPGENGRPLLSTSFLPPHPPQVLSYYKTDRLPLEDQLQGWHKALLCVPSPTHYHHLPPPCQVQRLSEELIHYIHPSSQHLGGKRRKLERSAPAWATEQDHSSKAQKKPDNWARGSREAQWGAVCLVGTLGLWLAFSKILKGWDLRPVHLWQEETTGR